MSFVSWLSKISFFQTLPLSYLFSLLLSTTAVCLPGSSDEPHALQVLPTHADYP